MNKFTCDEQVYLLAKEHSDEEFDSTFNCNYLLGKGGYVFGSIGLSVCSFVCLSVDNIAQKVMNGLG